MADDRSPSPPPDTSDVIPDNEATETAETYICSECGEVGKFEYTMMGDDAYCAKCKHPKCDNCKL
ncbi:hypothetical protein F5Y12DRAFT_771674, partial [Xylaria sp. FL1777]